MPRWISSLAIYKNPRVFAVLCLGIASGLPLPLTFGTLAIWLTEAGVNKATIGTFALIGTPYTLKFLWSHMVDHLPLPGLTRWLGKRRAWMLLAQAGLIVAMLGLGGSHPSEAAELTAWFALLVAILSATQDIAIDAYRVESLKEEEQAAGAAAIVLGYRLGMFAASAGALYIAEFFGWFAAYAGMAAIMGLGMLTTLRVKEPQHHRPPSEEERAHRATKLKLALAGACLAVANAALLHHWDAVQTALLLPLPLTETPLPLGSILGWAWLLVTGFMLAGILITLLTGKTLNHTTFVPLYEFTRREHWLAMLLFIILYKLGDAFAGVMTGPFIVELGFSKKEIADIVKSFGLAATLLGGVASGAMVLRLGLMRSLWICGILQMASNLMFIFLAQAGHSTWALAATIGVENFSGGMGGTVFVAYISGLCNRQFTATQYALLSSLAAVGRTWLSASSGWFASTLGWSQFFLLSTFAAIPGLALLWWLTRRLHFMPSGTNKVAGLMDD